MIRPQSDLDSGNPCTLAGISNWSLAWRVLLAFSSCADPPAFVDPPVFLDAKVSEDAQAPMDAGDAGVDGGAVADPGQCPTIEAHVLSCREQIPSDMVWTSQGLFWVDRAGSLRQLTRTGTAPLTLHFGEDWAFSLFQDENELVWAETSSPGRILRYDLRTGVTQVVITSRDSQIRSVAADDDAYYWLEYGFGYTGARLRRLERTAPREEASVEMISTGELSPGWLERFGSDVCWSVRDSVESEVSSVRCVRGRTVRTLATGFPSEISTGAGGPGLMAVASTECSCTNPLHACCERSTVWTIDAEGKTAWTATLPNKEPRSLEWVGDRLYYSTSHAIGYVSLEPTKRVTNLSGFGFFNVVSIAPTPEVVYFSDNRLLADAFVDIGIVGWIEAAGPR